MLEIAVLGSGSRGNCAVVRGDGVCLLVDAGLSALQINRRLGMVGLGIEDLDGILLTHEHGDHTRGIDVFCRDRRVPIFCTALTREVVRDSVRREMEWRLFESGEGFSMGALEVRSFPVPHDAVDPLGYVIDDGESVLGVVSDFGHVTGLVKDQLRAATAVFIEANYDEVMLQNDVRRPWATKQRISSRHGHLSNDQAAELVVESASGGLHRVILGHLSGDCNDPEVACEVVNSRLRKGGIGGVEVCCASQGRPTEWMKASEAARKRAEAGRGEDDVEAAAVEQPGLF